MYRAACKFSCCGKSGYLHQILEWQKQLSPTFFFISVWIRIFLCSIHLIHFTIMQIEIKMTAGGLGGPGAPFKNYWGPTRGPKMHINEININTNCIPLGPWIITPGHWLAYQNISFSREIMNKHILKPILWWR